MHGMMIWEKAFLISYELVPFSYRLIFLEDFTFGV